MKLRTRIALTTLAVTLPLVAALAAIDIVARRQAAEAALAELVSTKLETPGERQRCEADPRSGAPAGREGSGFRPAPAIRTGSGRRTGTAIRTSSGRPLTKITVRQGFRPVPKGAPVSDGCSTAGRRCSSPTTSSSVPGVRGRRSTRR
jgi:hypothetical protein